jgi:penicillin-binding protein 2
MWEIAALFNAKLNYLVCGFALFFLVLLGRFFYMQVVSYDEHEAQAEAVRRRVELLGPARARIYTADGVLIAQTETVWDVFLDWNDFASPGTLNARRRGDINVAPTIADLPAPASRRRFLLNWKARASEESQRDLAASIDQLSLLSRVPREEIAARFELVAREVNAILGDLDPATAKAALINAAWLRIKPALCDPEYWSRVRRYPKAVAFLPVLQARVTWNRREQEFLAILLERARDDRAARDLCGSAARNCDAKSREIADSDENVALLQPTQREEYAAWRRLFETCSATVHQGRAVLVKAHAALAPRIAGLEDRALRLQRDTIEKYAPDWKERWSEYEFEQNPLQLMREAPRDVVELLKLNADLLPGLECKLRASRTYSHAALLAPVLGGVGLPDPERLDEIMSRPNFAENLESFIVDWFEGDREAFTRFADGVVAQQAVGVFGIERAYDARLSGEYGARVSMHDARGRVRSIEFEQAPVNAEPLTLTLDLELQRDILETMARWEPKLAAQARLKSSSDALKGSIPSDRWARYRWSFRGAAVVLDVNTGAVLALVSFPTFDPGRMSGASDVDRVYRLQLKQEAEEDAKLPYWARHARQLNRASGTLYHPGSTWKAVTSIALLEEGLSPNERYNDVSAHVLIEKKKLGTGHVTGRELTITDALEVSSNGFFYYFASRLHPEGAAEDWDTMRYWAENLGFGQESGFELPGTRRANLADINSVSQPEISTMAIGQGKILVTPLELTRLYACIATRGKLSSPHLTGEATDFTQQIEIRDSTWDTLHAGLKQVVYGPDGTARQSQIDNNPILKEIRCAGKTGTAENGKGVPDHAWFAGFAPYEKPEVAFVILGEYSDLYGADISPVIGECIKRYLQRRGVLPATVLQRK